MIITPDERFMLEALKEARLALDKDEVPIGCVIVKDGNIIARAHNLKESLQLARGHAEVLAIDKASQVLGSWRLTGCELYVTIEPCSMCAGLIYQSRIDRLIFGAFDYKGGACGGSMNVLDVSDINHRVKVTSGVLKQEARRILQAFFNTKRM